MSRNLLPREGLYIDPIASFIKHSSLNPAIILPVLAAASLPNLFPSLLFNHVSSNQAWRVFIVVGVFALISTLIHGNDYLSRRAKNNYLVDPIWHGDWSRELVLITGAASEGGIGSSIVKRLSQRHIKIIVVDISPMSYDVGRNVHYYHCDLSDSKSLARTCAAIRTEHGHATVLINNAGVARGRTVAEGSYHDKDLTIKTNLLAPFFLIQEFVPHMIEENHGHILSISSMSAHISPIGLADYAASKAGLLALHDTLSLELAFNAPKIRLSVLVASFISTPMTKALGSTLDQTPFMAPLMHVDTVGDAITETLYSGYGRDIYLPGLMRYLAGIRGWPMWLQCAIRNGTTKTLLAAEEGKKSSASSK